jgi:hypothetical protein
VRGLAVAGLLGRDLDLGQPPDADEDAVILLQNLLGDFQRHHGRALAQVLIVTEPNGRRPPPVAFSEAVRIIFGIMGSFLATGWSSAVLPMPLNRRGMYFQKKSGGFFGL